jgi:spermidine dehydrogenase
VRLRLNSTVVNVANHGDYAVEVSYVSNGKALKVRGKHCILAGYNGMIPHLCPELPIAQKESLAYGVKAPFIWANVLLKPLLLCDKAAPRYTRHPAVFSNWLRTLRR